jgi:signal transduction histidine kinase
MYSAAKRFIQMSAMRNALQLAAFFIAIMIVAGFFLRFEISHDVHGRIDRELAQRAEVILSDVSPENGIPARLIGLGESAELGRSTGFLTNDGSILGVVKEPVFRRDGFRTLRGHRLFDNRYIRDIRSQSSQAHDEDDDDHDEDDDDDDHDHHFRSKDPFHANYWRIYVTTSDGGKLAVFAPIDEFQETLDIVSSILFPVSLIILATTLGGGFVLGFVQQRRVTRIQNALVEIASGNLSYRINPAKVRDDLDQLMVNIDDTSEKLETSVRQLRDFSRNVAHELRTPLTQLRGLLEDAEKTNDLGSAIKKTEAVIKIFDAIQRITRLDKHASTEHFEPVPLNNIANLMADLFTEVAEENKQTLIVKAESDQTVSGDWQLLAQLGSNLVENAMRHAGSGARITVSTTGNVFSVEDTGPGISKEDRSKVFEPFYKRDSVKGSEGTGLGLALVKAIANYHKATTSLDDGESGGLLVSIRFSETVKDSAGK